MNRQKILIGVLVIVLIIAGVYYSNLWRNSDIAEVLTTTEESPVVGEDVLILVNKLKSISIDPSIFDDSLFTSLADLSVQVNPENQSRPNPFAPIGTDIGSIQVSARIVSTD